MRKFRPPSNPPTPAEVERSGIERFNALPEKDAAAALRDCCGSEEWVRRMLARRPFVTAAELYETADDIWNGLKNDDWLEAFRHHPRIGERKAEKAQSGTAKDWSANEQTSVEAGSTQAKNKLAEANHAYEKKFGFIFIVCAAGKSPEEILAMLKRRLRNMPPAELRVAAEEQRKITCLRLEKMLNA